MTVYAAPCPSRIRKDRAEIFNQRGPASPTFDRLLVEDWPAVEPVLDLPLAPADRAGGEIPQPQGRGEVPALHTPPDRSLREARDSHDLRCSEYPIHLESPSLGRSSRPHCC